MAQQRLFNVAQHLQQPHGDNTITSGPAQSPSYTIWEQPLGTPRRLRIVGIGAGASGLNMIRTLRKHLTNYEHVVYEKNPRIGGTWFENRYPGCKCDIPSHNYQFSWFPYPEWSSFFSPAEEIEQYLCQVCDQEQLGSAIKLQHLVVKAQWIESHGQWDLRIKDLQTGEVFDDYCHFLLDASGILNDWKWPDIPGLHDFKGDLIHSADWPQGFDYAQKTVAVIGNGSSGIQIVPAIQQEVKHLVHFIRSPTWIAPPRLQTLFFSKAGNILSEIEMDQEGNFTARQIEKFKADPDYYKKFVKAVEEEVNGNFPIMIKDSQHAALVTERMKDYIVTELDQDQRLCEALIPKFPLGCRRLTPGVGYLPALRADNVRVVTEGIARFVPQGIELTTGEIIQLDAIICATGFDVSFRPRFPIIGREGNLQDIWTQNLPASYMSCAVPGFPNFFTFLGPNAPIGHGSVFTITEYIAKYMTRIFLKCQLENIKAIAPSPRAVSDLMEHTRTFMPRTAWAGSCRSWFKGGQEEGPVTALHPGSRIHFFHMLERFRGEDWEYTYDNDGSGSNRFRYLGNGFSTKELGGGDSTWYLDRPDALD